MRAASTALPPAIHGTLRTVVIGYGVAAFTWLFTRRGLIEDPLAAASSNTARLLFAFGIGCQILAFIARRWIKRRFEDEAGANAAAIVEILADGATVLVFAVATFRGINSLAVPL
jgi:hypothetical protein